MWISGVTLYVSQEEAGVQAVLAGADLLEKPADVDAMIRGVREAVKSRRINGARLNESVRKILAWKYELGLFKQKITSLDQIDRVVSTKDVGELSDEIGEKAITLVRSDAGAIPLDRSKKVCILAISNTFEADQTIGV